MKKIGISIFILQFLIVPSVFAQMRQIDLTIFGMDCAICAHGVQKGLMKIQGVQKVDVSIEKGLAHIELEPENTVSLQQIETAVRRNGFSPKGGSVELKGKIENKTGNSLAVIVTGSNESIMANMSNAGSIDHQKEYVIRGNLKIDDKGGQTLAIVSAN